MVISYRERSAGVVAYARWRDSNRVERTQRVGAVWAERHGERWRNRRGKRPDGALTVEQAHARALELAEAQEVRLVEAESQKQASFESVASEWMRYGRQIGGWSPATVKDRQWTLGRHLLPAFGGRPACMIASEEVKRWWSELHDPRREEGRLSDRNANKLLTELRALFNWARRQDTYGVASNPADGIGKHREHTSDAAPFYTPDEIEALASHAANPQDALAFKLAAFAGLRRGELVSLRWRSIDFARQAIFVTEAVSAGQDVRPKWGQGRIVPLAPQLAQGLAAWRPPQADPDALVFQNTVGGKLDGSALSRRYRAARDRAGLRPLRFHDLRHTFGTLAIDGGASLVQVQAWLGHSELATTSRYLHTRSRASDADLLGQAFDG